MSDDPYQILGISRNSSEDDIKRAYKRLAREHHPDKGGSNEKFQEINRAYETLTNPQNDNIHGQNEEEFIFHMFNQFRNVNVNSNKKLPNTYYNYNISLRDTYFGLQKKFKIKKSNLCSNCNVTCTKCNGRGTLRQQIQNGPFMTIHQTICPTCNGNGIIVNLENNNGCCTDGKIYKEQIVTIDIPVNVDNGKQYIFREWGEQPRKDSDIPGDFVIVVMIDTDHDFTRNGLDLIYNCTISLRESIVGNNIIIPHFKEHIHLDLSGFGIINPNKRYTLYNRGMPGGHLHIVFKIDYPECVLTEIQKNKLDEILKNFERN